MAVKLDRFAIKNVQRGKATVLARFDVNFGPMTIKGFELIRVGDKTFVAEPSNSFKGTDGNWKTFKYVAYAGSKGEELQKQIHSLASEEMSRRGTQPPPTQASKPSYADEDDLPFSFR